MRQWGIYDFPFPSAEQAHPFVILSPAAVTENVDYENVNALMCVSVRGGYEIKPRDVRLNGADGLDGPTVVRCHVIFQFLKSSFGAERGFVTPTRRTAIIRTIGKCFFDGAS